MPPSTTSTRSSMAFGTRPQSIHSPHASLIGMPSNNTAVRPSSTPRIETICAVPPTRLLVRGSSTAGISRRRSCDSRAGLCRTCSGVSTLTVDATLLASTDVRVAETMTLGEQQRAFLEREVERRRASGRDGDRAAVGLRPIAEAYTVYVPAGTSRRMYVAASFGDRHALRRDDGDARAHDRSVRLARW